MLLDIVTEYNSKVTFLNIQKKKNCVYKVYRIIQIISYIYYSKIRKQSYLKLEVKYFHINTTLNSNKRLIKVLFVKKFLRNF